MKNLLLAGLILTSSAQASDWYLVSMTSENTVYFIDVSSISSPTPYTRRAWSQEIHADMTSAKRLIAYQCTKREMGTSTLIRYDSLNVLSSQKTFSQPLYVAVPPDSIGDTMLGAVCSKSPAGYIKAKNGAKIEMPPLEAAKLVWDGVRKINESDSVRTDPTDTSSPATEQPSAPNGDEIL